MKAELKDCAKNISIMRLTKMKFLRTIKRCTRLDRVRVESTRELNIYDVNDRIQDNRKIDGTRLTKGLIKNSIICLIISHRVDDHRNFGGNHWKTEQAV